MEYCGAIWYPSIYGIKHLSGIPERRPIKSSISSKKYREGWWQFDIAERCVHVAFIRCSLTRLNSPLTGDSYLILLHDPFHLFLKFTYPNNNRLILRINAQNSFGIYSRDFNRVGLPPSSLDMKPVECGWRGLCVRRIVQLKVSESCGQLSKRHDSTSFEGSFKNVEESILRQPVLLGRLQCDPNRYCSAILRFFSLATSLVHGFIRKSRQTMN